MLPTSHHPSCGKHTAKQTGMVSTPSQLAQVYGFERHQRAYSCPVEWADDPTAKIDF